MRNLVKTNYQPLFNNLFDLDTPKFGQAKFTPSVNITEDEKSYQLNFSLAGFKKEDLNINLENDTLTVSAKVEKENETEGVKYTRKEFTSQSFSRSFYLPEQINEESIEASFENGILSLSLPKSEKAQSKEIAIK